MEIRLRDFLFNQGKIRDYELLVDEQMKALIEFEEKVGELTGEIDRLGERLDGFNVKIVTGKKEDEQSADAE